jgi:hypothetical protein
MYRTRINLILELIQSEQSYVDYLTTIEAVRFDFDQSNVVVILAPSTRTGKNQETNSFR